MPAAAVLLLLLLASLHVSAAAAATASLIGHGVDERANGTATFSLSEREREGIGRLFAAVDGDDDGSVDVIELRTFLTFLDDENAEDGGAADADADDDDAETRAEKKTTTPCPHPTATADPPRRARAVPADYRPWREREGERRAGASRLNATGGVENFDTHSTDVAGFTPIKALTSS